MAMTVVSIHDAGQQFRGVYERLWLVRATNNFGSVAAGAETNTTVSVPGLELGDHVISYSGSDNTNASLFIKVYVSAADTINVVLTNVHASSAVDLADMTYEFVIGRPAF